jgi:hypothetical protein
MRWKSSYDIVFVRASGSRMSNSEGPPGSTVPSRRARSTPRARTAHASHAHASSDAHLSRVRRRESRSQASIYSTCTNARSPRADDFKFRDDLMWVTSLEEPDLLWLALVADVPADVVDAFLARSTNLHPAAYTLDADELKAQWKAEFSAGVHVCVARAPSATCFCTICIFALRTLVPSHIRTAPTPLPSAHYRAMREAVPLPTSHRHPLCADV